MITTDELLSKSCVIPVLAIEDLGLAAPLARALADGGLRVVELTLRTEHGLAAVSRMREAAPELVIGMGTVRTPTDVAKAIDAGSDFLVTPGSTPKTLQAIANAGVPAMPAAATATEALIAQDFGFSALKMFPAERCGGIAWLKDIAGPMPDIVWCPSGGIGVDMVERYLALANVECVGGSWIAPKATLADAEWSTITDNAKKAVSFKPSVSDA
ncbi:MAG: bifunctional 4-hydroxy-2-oxoglutarate aldolase/2-dehydro-3-deoxy-phosphogluconate aldolase [Pseudomonadota bacterium]